MKQQELRLKEREVSRQVTDFLQWRGWRLLRNNVTKLQDYAGNWVKYGEPGMPDFLALYYRSADETPGAAVALWVEVKQLGGKLRPNQVIWHRDELARGGLVVVADEFETFEQWYWEHFSWLHQQQGQGYLFKA